jgi:hypothetical protein
VWARKETIAYGSWKCKVYGTFIILGCLLMTPFFAGMPLHRLWQRIGTPILLATAYCFTVFLYHGGLLLSETLDY